MTTHATPRTARILTALRSHPRRTALGAGITALTVGGLLFALPGGVAASPAACESALRAAAPGLMARAFGGEDLADTKAPAQCDGMSEAEVTVIGTRVTAELMGPALSGLLGGN